jgi:glycerophosphoryl diester phosphodiesterase
MSLATPKDAAACLVAHRGYPAHYPENTLVGMAAAVRAGARYLEFDVQLTADTVPVVFHDTELARTTDATGCLLDMNWAQLAGVHAGEPRRFGSRYAAEPLPSLAAVVELLRGQPQVVAFVELKRASLQRCGREAMLERVLCDIAPVAAQCVLISFDAEAVALARERGAAAVGWVTAEYSPAALAQARALAPDYLFCNVAALPPAMPALEDPWRWVLYEVTAPALARQWLARGAALVETFAIAEMLQALAGDGD